MLAPFALTDLFRFIQKRLAYARYYVGSSFTQIPISECKMVSGYLRASLVINPADPCVITRVELYNSDKQCWAYQDCEISVTPSETGLLYWFDFKIEEVEDNG